MHKTKLAMTLLGSLLLGGCATLENSVAPTQDYKAVVMDRERAMQALSAATPCCTDLATLPYRELAVGNSQLAAVDANSPVYLFAEGKSFAAAYRLPVHSGDLKITVEGIIDHTLFNPVALLLDSRFQVTRKLGPSVFNYEQAQFISGSSVSGTFTVDRSQVGNPNNESYLLIYTDESRLGETTTVMSDAKLMAKSKAVTDYGIKDSLIPHSPWGVLRLSVEDLGGEKGANHYKPAYAPGTDAIKAQAAQPKPEAAPNKLVVPVMEASSPAPAMLSETEAFYRTQIEKAVEAGDIDKAMLLVNEAERAGSTQAKSVFIDAVKRSQKN